MALIVLLNGSGHSVNTFYFLFLFIYFLFVLISIDYSEHKHYKSTSFGNFILN